MKEFDPLPISGSIVVFNFTKDKVVVAADSLALNHDTGVPNYSYCKIAAFGDQLVFSSVGNAGFSSSGRKVWDNVDLAKEAFGSVGRGDIVKNWASLVANHWRMVDRRQAMAANEANGGQLTAGVFIGKELTGRVAVVYFDRAAIDNPIHYGTGTDRDLTNCWPCGQRGGRICAAGDHVDTVLRFCSERKPGSGVAINTKLEHASEEAKLVVKIVETVIATVIATHGKTAVDVGLPVDALTITRKHITWNARKKECPDRKD